MSKSMEDFFRKHRGAFDTESPGRHVWDGVDQAIRPSSGRIIYWQVAAVFFFCCSAWLWFSGYSGASGIASSESADRPSISAIEDFYALRINQREAWFSGNTPSAGTPGIEYQRLTSMYEVLRLAWEKNPSDELRDAMALNLIIRLDMLDRLTESGFKSEEKNDNTAGMVYR